MQAHNTGDHAQAGLYLRHNDHERRQAQPAVWAVKVWNFVGALLRMAGDQSHGVQSCMQLLPLGPAHESCCGGVVCMICKAGGINANAEVAHRLLIVRGVTCLRQDLKELCRPKLLLP